jgi:hypothetical protein
MENGPKQFSELKRGKNMTSYVYEKKTLHINRFRRKGDGDQTGSGSGKISKDRRHGKVRDGIILVEHDRRKKDDPDYSGPERRSDTQRRSGKDRREKR